MRTINALRPLALALAGACGLAPSLAAFDVANHRTAAPPAPRSNHGLRRLPRLCAGNPGLTDEQLGITETDRRAIDLGRTDLAAALALIEAGDQPEQRRRARYALIYRLCEDDLGFLSKLPAVLGEPVTPPILAPPDTLSAWWAVGDICSFWAGKDPDKLFEAVQALQPSVLGTRARSWLAPTLAPVHFSKAAALLAALPDSDKSIDVVTQVVAGYKGDDPSDLLPWLQNFPPSSASGALVALAQNLQYHHDLARLQKLALGEPLPRGGIVPFIFGNALGKDDPDHVLARVDALAAPPEKKAQILKGALQAMPESKSRDVASRLLELEPPETRAAVISRAISRLFAMKRDAAIRMAMESPDDVRSASLQTLVDEWYRTDPAGLADWISKLPKGPDRDLVEGFQSDHILRANKDKALEDAEKARQLHRPPAN